jgi:hypothetical protein
MWARAQEHSGCRSGHPGSGEFLYVLLLWSWSFLSRAEGSTLLTDYTGTLCKTNFRFWRLNWIFLFNQGGDRYAENKRTYVRIISPNPSKIKVLSDATFRLKPPVIAFWGPCGYGG